MTRWEGDSQGIWPFCQIVNAQNRIFPRECDTYNSLEFQGKNRSPDPGLENWPSDNLWKTGNLSSCGFCHPGWPQKLRRETST